MKNTQKSPRSTTATRKNAEAFTDAERAAIKERVRETKAAADKADGESAVLAKIAEMKEPDRAMAKRLHAVIKASAPALSPRPWYGMPSYAKGGKSICFFQPPQKFKARDPPFGSNEPDNLAEGPRGPAAFPLSRLPAPDAPR